MDKKKHIASRTFSDVDSLITGLQVLRSMAHTVSDEAEPVILIEFDVQPDACRDVAARLYQNTLTDGSKTFDIELG